MEKVDVMKKELDFFKDKKVFVTGHTGFKGSWLLCYLHQLNATIKGYSLAPEGDKNLFDEIKGNIKFENVIADIRDKEKLKKEILDFQPDIIFHLAAQALVRRSYEIPSETFEVNAIGTANLLEAVIPLNKKCTVVIITTDKVYENKEIDYHYEESDVLGGYDPYSASKAATELVVSSFRNSFFNIKNYAEHQKAIVSARAGNVIGGGDWSKDRIIPDIIKALESNLEIEVRNPQSVRPWQHVLEPLSGYIKLSMLAHEKYNAISGAYNFGPLPSDHLPVSELVALAIKKWGAGTWLDTSNPNQPHEAGLLKLSINKAIEELNWQPKLNSHQAIEWTIDWYKKSSTADFEFTLSQIKSFIQL
jgi:CDP-glucose 4,6-dehydratase